MNQITVTNQNDHSITVTTPLGIIMISHFDTIGTGVYVYDDEDHNPITMVELRDPERNK